MFAEIFRTDSIDLAAYLMTVGFTPLIICPDGERRAIFVFAKTAPLLVAIVGYEVNCSLPAKRLLEVRRRLFEVISQEAAGGAGL